MNAFDLAAEARVSVAIEERCDWKKWGAGLVEGGSLLGRDGYNSSLRPLCRFLATTFRPLWILCRSHDVNLVTFWGPL